MRYRVRVVATGAAISLMAAMTQLAPAAHAARPTDERAAAPVVTAKMTATKITLSEDSVRAGLLTFKATTKKGVHDLQLVKLAAGYPPEQAFADVALAFKGNLDAIARVDKNIDFLGGAEAKPGTAGWYQVSLKAGQYFALDADTNTLAPFAVTGSVQKRGAEATEGTITTFSYGFRTDGTLPANGWITATNRADQPHFIVLQHVKNGTTRQQVAKFFATGGNGNPPWGLKGGTSLGVLSPGQSVARELAVPKAE
jgi:hypothetical protein